MGWKQAKSRDELIKAVAKETGYMPYQIRVKRDGTITARSGDTETVVGEWVDPERD